MNAVSHKFDATKEISKSLDGTSLFRFYEILGHAFMAEASKWIAFSVLSQIKLDVVLGLDKSSPNHLLEYWRLTSDGREQ